MAKGNTGNGGGIGFIGLLQIVFLVLKLAKVITWSWWWVLAPMWMPAAFILMVAIVCVLQFLIDKN